MTYRHDNQVPQLRTGIAVLVQKMVAADCSGIMFTRDPVDGEDKVIIEASFGLGESIASGIVTPDQYICEGEQCKLKQRKINRKLKAIFLSEKRMDPTDLDEEMQNAPGPEGRRGGEDRRAGTEIGGALQFAAGRGMGHGGRPYLPAAVPPHHHPEQRQDAVDPGLWR